MPLNGWIPIANPPPASVDVLIWTPFAGCCIGSYSLVNEAWFDACGEEVTKPTHWQLLPNGPQSTSTPLDDEIIAKFGGKEATAGSGFKFWDFVYSHSPGSPHDVENILRIHSPKCQPGEGAGVMLFEKRRGFLEGIELYNNYCHTVDDLLDLLRMFKITHTSPRG